MYSFFPSFSEIGFESLTPDYTADNRGPFKSLENLKNTSFSSLTFLTPVAKKGPTVDSARPAKPQDREDPAVVQIKTEPLSPRPSNENLHVGPLVTPNFKVR